MEGNFFVQGGQRNRLEVKSKYNNAIIYVESRLAHKKAVRNQKVYNKEDFYVDLSLYGYPNTLNHYIAPNFHVRKFNRCSKKVVEEWIRREGDLNETRLEKKYKFVHVLDSK